jgi:hypothetical protein
LFGLEVLIVVSQDGWFAIFPWDFASAKFDFAASH